jgi:hypothetical protein
MRSVCCLYVRLCAPTITLNQLVDFHKIQQEGHATESDLSAIILIP